MAPAPLPEQPQHDSHVSRLIEHLINAQEIDRQRIASRIHDDPLQAMVAVALRMQLLAAKLPDEDRPNMEALNEAVTMSVSRLRSLIFALQPAALDQTRLGFVLESYLTQLSDEWDAKVELHYEVQREPPAYLALTVFRIVQDALANAREYTSATVVRVDVTTQNDGILTEVTHNGVGAQSPDERATVDNSLALIQMRERAKAVGGWWRLDVAPGTDTTYRFWVPTTVGQAEVSP